MRGSQQIAPDAEKILHDTVNRREPLELSGRLETPHLALTLDGRLMGGLRDSGNDSCAASNRPGTPSASSPSTRPS